MYIDRKNIVFGLDYQASKKLVVHNPTLSEIFAYGEDRYIQDISATIMRPYDAAVFLYDLGKDYRDVDNFEFFYTFGYQMVSTDCILFPGVNITEFNVGINQGTGEYVLYNKEIVIDKIVYTKIVSAIREFHFLPDKVFINPGSKYALKVWVKQQKEKMKRDAKKKRPEFSYADIISSLVNLSGFKYNYDTVRDIHISQLLDSFYRQNKIIEYQNIMNGLFSGNLDHDKIDIEDISWFSKIDLKKQSNTNQTFIDGGSSSPS